MEQAYSYGTLTLFVLYEFQDMRTSLTSFYVLLIARRRAFMFDFLWYIFYFLCHNFEIL